MGRFTVGEKKRKNGGQGKTRPSIVHFYYLKHLKHVKALSIKYIEKGGGKGQNQVNQQVKTEMGDDTDVNIGEIYKVLRAQGRKLHKRTRG